LLKAINDDTATLTQVCLVCVPDDFSYWVERGGSGNLNNTYK